MEQNEHHLTWTDLCAAFDEMEEWDRTGVLRGGVLRNFTDLIGPNQGVSLNWLLIARQKILMEIARRAMELLRYQREHCLSPWFIDFENTRLDIVRNRV
jgi:hypothetical protein